MGRFVVIVARYATVTLNAICFIGISRNLNIILNVNRQDKAAIWSKTTHTNQYTVDWYAKTKALRRISGDSLKASPSHTIVWDVVGLDLPMTVTLPTGPVESSTRSLIISNSLKMVSMLPPRGDVHRAERKDR